MWRGVVCVCVCGVWCKVYVWGVCVVRCVCVWCVFVVCGVRCGVCVNKQQDEIFMNVPLNNNRRFIF